MEVNWKTVTVILNRCLGLAITFHDILHGFCAGKVMRTTSLEAKMIQHMEDMREEVLYNIFLGVHKAYNAFYRHRCIRILAAYRVGTRAICFLQR